ncbi:MocR-like pyridoxine biosynthesis transcription factor PdxR, partial [Zymomonas mobilis]
MKRSVTSIGSLIAFIIDRDDKTPVYKQLYYQIHAAILDGRLEAGSRLPASRILAQELGLSRNSVVTALDHLHAEGYVISRTGDGTYVADSLPEEHLAPRSGLLHIMTDDAILGPGPSERGRLFTELSVTAGPALPIPFVADLPAFDAFPLPLWKRFMVQSWQEVRPTMLGYADPAGFRPLRKIIASHLGASRLLRCQSSEVVMTSGSQQSLDLISRVLLDQGDPVWIEEPGYIGARCAFLAAGARLIPVPVDEAGLNVEAGRALEPHPRLIFISPSRQYPLGMTMPMARRQALLDYAERIGAWVIEDDYDCEFRYRGSPLPAVRSLDRSQRVIYLGTFSKSLLPSFRLGYLVLPETIQPVFTKAKAIIDRHPPLLEQIALGSFFKTGQFAAHIRRMRQLYHERQDVLLDELHQVVGSALTFTAADTGMHLIAFLPDNVSDLAFCDLAREYGISLRPLSIYYLSDRPKQGLIMGFAAIPVARIRWGVKQLRKVVDQMLSQKGT